MALDPAERARIGLELWHKALDDGAGVLKLYFALSTGAVVLFVNLLAGAHLRRAVLIPLAASILSFGFAAVWCLRFLLDISRVRMILGQAITQGETAENVQRQMQSWVEQARKPAKRMERLFWGGIASAVVFVLAVLLSG